jgi:lipopolysaccharide transport system ATP-binding protein
MAGADPCAVGFPTIFHVTHWKAGSQWINKILNRCVGDRVVFAQPEAAQFLRKPLLEGRVYTTCYLTRDQFYSVPLPEPSHRFIVIRDLRDTLVSLYFSARYSHADHSRLSPEREGLNVFDLESGLLYLLDLWLPGCAEIQRSWLESGDTLIRYEDLLERDVEILVPLLTRQCPLGVPARRVREAVLACRFAQLAGGRARGEENLEAHERKGVVGDWRNHFTDRVTRAFKARFGDLLVATGYEKDLHW